MTVEWCAQKATYVHIIRLVAPWHGPHWFEEWNRDLNTSTLYIATTEGLVCNYILFFKYILSPAEIVGSNLTGVMDICLLWVLCVVRKRSLRRADHSSRGVLPTVMRRCVWSRNLKNEEATTRVGSQRHRKKCVYKYIYIYTHTHARTHTHTHIVLHLSGRRLFGSDRLDPSGKSVENSTKLSCLIIADYRIKYSTVLWLLVLQIRRSTKFYTKIQTWNSDSRTSGCQCSLFSKKHPIQMNQPTRCTNWLQVYCLSFKYRSICFGHPYAHHQEPINCSSSLWFYIRLWLPVAAMTQPSLSVSNWATCFARNTAHHQELKNCKCSLWFYIRLWLPVAAMA
jgi:hypothetical protein